MLEQVCFLLECHLTNITSMLKSSLFEMKASLVLLHIVFACKFQCTVVTFILFAIMDRNLVSFEISLSNKFTIALVTPKIVGRLFLGWLNILVAVFKQRSIKSFLIGFESFFLPSFGAAIDFLHTEIASTTQLALELVAGVN